MNIDDFRQTTERLRQSYSYRKLVPRSNDGIILVEPDGTRLINFGSNDYLGHAAQPSPKIGELPSQSGSSASALVCGWTDSHQRLAEQIASLESAESAVLFPSGYAACSGTVATLAREGDHIFSDQLNHASLIDGCRLSKSHCHVYSHRDLDHLQTLLDQHRSQARRAWIVTDTVFSMDGTLAPLREILALASRYGAEVIADEAHGTGVLGSHGAGLCEELHVQDRVAVRIGTLSKAIGAQGGFVVASSDVTEFLVNHCRPLIFSTSLSPIVADMASLNLSRFETESYRRERVRSVSASLRNSLGIEASGLEAEIPIVSIVLGGNDRAIEASNQLRSAGFYVPAIRPPTVPAGTSRLRVSLSAAHTDSQIDSLTETLLQILG